MIERAEADDCLSVGVALDYVMDGLDCSRNLAKSHLYRLVAKMITESAKDYTDQSVATTLSLYLYADNVQDAKLFMQGYGNDREWKKRTKRLVKLCSWVEGTP